MKPDDVKSSTYIDRTFYIDTLSSLFSFTVGTFYEKELQKTNKKRFRVEKIIKKKGDKLYVK